MPLDQQFEELENAHEKEMSFIEHLEELRWHLVRSTVAIFIVAVVIFIAKKAVFDFLIFGPTKPDFPTYNVLCNISDKIGIGKAFCFESFQFTIINIEVAGRFNGCLSICFLGILAIYSPSIASKRGEKHHRCCFLYLSFIHHWRSFRLLYSYPFFISFLQ